MSRGSTMRRAKEGPREKSSGQTSTLNKFKEWLEKKTKRKIASTSRKVNRKGKK